MFILDQNIVDLATIICRVPEHIRGFSGTFGICTTTFRQYDNESEVIQEHRNRFFIKSLLLMF